MKRKRKFNCDREWDKAERELAKLGAKLSTAFVDRAKELIIELSKFNGVEINYLIMGMGSWVLDAKVPYKEYWGENLSKVDEGVHEFDFNAFRIRYNRVECYENVNPGISKVVIELDHILETLTNKKYLRVFDIDAVEMKKLLTT